jgi:hypothetical protein
MQAINRNQNLVQSIYLCLKNTNPVTKKNYKYTTLMYDIYKKKPISMIIFVSFFVKLLFFKYKHITDITLQI